MPGMCLACTSSTASGNQTWVKLDRVHTGCASMQQQHRLDGCSSDIFGTVHTMSEWHACTCSASCMTDSARQTEQFRVTSGQAGMHVDAAQLLTGTLAVHLPNLLAMNTSARARK